MRLAKIVLATIAACVVGYFAAALALGVVPANDGSAPPPQGRGTRIFVASNGVHTDLIVPMVSASRDWRPMLAGDWTPPDVSRFGYVAIGWGDRAFYLETPTWADLKVSTALRAVTGMNGTVLHVQATGTPFLSDRVRSVMLTDDRFQRLNAYIVASFARDTTGLPIPIASAHYNRYDIFYAATGYYSFVFTCNEWARAGLRHANVRVPVWSPFAAAIFFHLPAG